jgi:hypothetical protein
MKLCRADSMNVCFWAPHPAPTHSPGAGGAMTQASKKRAVEI